MSQLIRLIGRRVKFFREEAGLSIKDLAEKINFPSAFIALLEEEDPEMRLTFQLLYKIADGLSIHPRELLPSSTTSDDLK